MDEHGTQTLARSRKSAGDGQIRAARGLERMGMPRDAAAIYESILADDDANFEAWSGLAAVWERMGDLPRAVEMITRAAALRPRSAEIHARLAEMQLAAKQFVEAVQAACEAIDLGADTPEVRCTLGLALRGLNLLEDAEREFRLAIARRPWLAPAWANLGLVYQGRGKVDEALAAFGKAVELDPTCGLLRTNLGQMLLNLNRPIEALPHCAEGARLRPDVATIRHNYGLALRANGHADDAEREFRQAIALDPNLASSHAYLGLLLLGQGRLNDAGLLFSRAVTLAPTNPAYWEWLASAHCELGEYQTAIPCWERAIALDPNPRASRHSALGWSLQEEGRPEEAEVQFRKVLELEPDSGAPRLDIGLLAKERGDFAAAEVEFREALRLDPDNPLGHSRLAKLLGGKLPDADLAALRARIAAPGLGDADLGWLRFALGLVLDGRGDYPAAAAEFREANARTLAWYIGHRVFNPQAHALYTDGFIRWFGPEFFERVAGGGDPTRRPVFIVGMPRSGSTLLEQVLSSHPAMHGAGELMIARRFYLSLPVNLGAPGVEPGESASRLDVDASRRLSRLYLNQLEPLAPSAERIVDKMPENFIYLGMLAALFPNATILHCRRDPRDVALSCYMADFRGIYWTNHPDHIAAKFRDYYRLMAHWRSCLPLQIHDVAYEDMVADLEGQSRRVVETVGLDWDPACLDFHRTRRSVRTASVTQVRQPLYKGSVARWKRYEHELADLFAALPSPDAGMEK